ncbi:MAG: RidA family protein [Gammaproteobacteria bacterium]
MPGKIETRLTELGVTLPAPLQIPAGVEVPLVMVKVVGKRVIVSGHGPMEQDGSIATPLGQLGSELTVEQGVEAARKTALAMVGTLQRELGDLDRIRSWVKVLGMVNSAPGFNQQTPVINGFSLQIIDIFGKDCGMAARSAIGVAQLPFSIPVEVEAELELH